MHHAKNCENKEIPLAILSRILAQSCVTLCLNICREGLCMIVLVSLIVLLRGFPCFHKFSHDASHPYIPIGIDEEGDGDTAIKHRFKPLYIKTVALAG